VIGGSFSDEPFYFSCFVIELFPFHNNIFIPSKSAVKVQSQVLYRFDEKYDSLTDTDWRALTFSKGEHYV